MKKILFVILPVIAIGGADAGVMDVYAGATGGFGYKSNRALFEDPAASEDRSASSFGVVAGIDIPVFRVEAEYNYITSYAGDMGLFLVNGYVKAPIPMIKPYIGMGIGTLAGPGEAYFSSASFSGEAEEVFAIQAMAGVQIEIPATKLFVDLEFRPMYLDGVYKVVGETETQNRGFWHADVRLKVRYIIF